MTVTAKICGLNDEASVAAAISGGASHVGFVFYPPSPRSLAPEQAAPLARQAGNRVTRVGLFVDPDDDLLGRILAQVPLDLLQLHGGETPDRVMAIKSRFGLPAMKVVKVAEPADLDAAKAYGGVADWLMFDAKAPKSLANALPGGNAVAFDWRILAGRKFAMPWMLAGGLTLDNLATAVERTGAKVVDTSSGVEDAPGRKNPAKIKAFLAKVKTL